MSATKQDAHPFKSAAARDAYLAFYERHAAEWPVPSETMTIDTEDGRTFVRVSGPIDGPPLVLLPAGRTPSTCWIPLVESLSAGFRIYAVDAIYDDGLSVSSKPIKTTDDATGWLDRLFDALGLDDRHHPDGHLLRRLALRGIPAPCARAPRQGGLGCPRPVWWRPMSGEFIARSMVCLIPSERAFRWVTRWIMEDAAKSEPEFFEDAVAEMALSEKCFKFRMWPGGGPRKLSDDELRGIEVPVLYVVGENERICDPQAAIARLNAVAPQIQSVMIPGAGHDAVWVQTEAVRRAVLEFLEAR